MFNLFKKRKPDEIDLIVGLMEVDKEGWYVELNSTKDDLSVVPRDNNYVVKHPNCELAIISGLHEHSRRMYARINGVLVDKKFDRERLHAGIKTHLVASRSIASKIEKYLLEKEQRDADTLRSTTERLLDQSR